jgi:MFS family permease
MGVRRLRDGDLVSALVLFFIGAVSLSEAGSDVRNWIFPLLATYLILAIAAALLARVVIAAVMERLPDIIPWDGEDRVVLIDLVVFGAIVLAYMFVMYGLGFWLSSLLMLSLTSIYLTLEKTRRNLVLAIVVPLGACVLAYLVFLHVFYVPLPEARWWPGVG